MLVSLARCTRRSVDFVLEFLQNADDNEYARSLPRMSFIIGGSWIVVDNNEVGWSV